MISPKTIRSRAFKKRVINHFLNEPRTGRVLAAMGDFYGSYGGNSKQPFSQLRGVIELLCLRSPPETWEFPAELMKQLYDLTSQTGNRK